MEPRFIRNFCIIAHIDHGKSTLADRFLELTGTLSPREMTAQVLDQMELEQEKGITLKAKAVRMSYRGRDGHEYELNLIDTPGHVDFTYEVSRSLAACEAAILVVDASQGIQAQTLANAYLALEQDLSLIPVVNKIDLPKARPQEVAAEMTQVLGVKAAEILLVSAKEGTGVPAVLEAIVRRVPPPRGSRAAALRALVFDSKYDPYKGVVAFVRIVDGCVSGQERLMLLSTGKVLESLEIGVFKPAMVPIAGLSAGEVGYIATGLKNVRDCEVGDTITHATNPAQVPLPGYRPVKPMVFAGLYPVEAQDYGLLRDALDKLRLNDASLSYEPEGSLALGHGFRCGFLGLLHMEIVRERLEREYGLRLLVTAPSVAYRVVTHDGAAYEVSNPAVLPPPATIREMQEPWLEVSLLVPQPYLGPVMELAASHRGRFRSMEYLEAGPLPEAPAGEGALRHVLLSYELPLTALLADFYNELKSRTQGYGSLDYHFSHYETAPLVKLDILVNGRPVDALSLITHTERAYQQGRALVEKLRELIPRQLFDVAVQAAVGQRVIARETIKALRKNVLAKCYGGDVTRKRKLLEKQAEGKKRMKRIGQVELPPEAFTAVLKLEP